jgi:hypothetical protein
MRTLAWILVMATAARAIADDTVASSTGMRPFIPSEPAPEPAPAPQAPEPDARDSRTAPLPGMESGRIDVVEVTETTSRKVARAALFLPRMLMEAVLWPVNQGFELEGRYELSDWYYRLLYNNNRTIGVIPVATWETGYGLTAGLRFFDLDTFGEQERLVLQATAGVTYRVGLLASLDTGDRLGPVRLEGAGNFDRRPAEPFYGIGNNSPDEATHFRYQEERAAGLLDLHLSEFFHVDARGTITSLKYGPSTTEPSLSDVFDTMDLAGFSSSANQLYGELALRWDNRQRVSPWEPITVRSQGSLAVAYGGYVHPFDDRAGFWHYGAELQHYLRFGFGPRVIVARFHGEAVTGNLQDVPITELPMLGGGAFLRGYPYGRFRDRIAAVASLQYMWSLFAFSSADVFTDVGRVYHSWDDLTLSDMRAGFGVGLEFYTARSFIADVAIGTSVDGGVTLMAEFSPVLDARTRWR